MATAEPVGSYDFPIRLGQSYARWTLDSLIEIGYVVSLDFVNRPQLFTGSDIPDEIVDLRMSYGTAADFPNTAQRLTMMMPVFGKSDGLKPEASGASTPFYLARKKFLEACIAFSERAVDTGVQMLEERVRSAIVPFRAYFEGLHGKSVQQSAKQLETIFEAVIDILTSAGVARVYSVLPADDSWPLNSDDPTINSNGAKLVEAVGMVLPVSADYKFNYAKFILLQRVAQEGMRTLPQVLTVDMKDEGDMQSLISNGYSWATSLRDFQQMS
jgi:hypothetical protein